jgi:hypothetical protein
MMMLSVVVVGIAELGGVIFVVVGAIVAAGVVEVLLPLVGAPFVVSDVAVSELLCVIKQCPVCCFCY